MFVDSLFSLEEMEGFVAKYRPFLTAPLQLMLQILPDFAHGKIWVNHQNPSGLPL